ncbi:MAG TPA: TRAP transporter large permease [Candidatus Methylomirabilis sp.]|nr:TRAP transporter large permease [Candidatus Methylomirabilis sp.]HSC72273.1 TRAP transporter large permease [Candidatus Methylomirabilis sp.]
MAGLIPLLFVLFLIGIPITFSLGVVSLLGLILAKVPLLLVVQRLWTAVDTFSLVAVPLFILAGDLMSQGGISRRLVDFAQALVGHFTSGLAMVAVVACMFFAAVSGSAIADAAAIGGILIPTMVANRYHPPFTASLVAAAGTIGPIIPPSIPMVLYGAMTNTSIAMLFAGGFLPGVLMGTGLMVYAYYVGKRRGYRGREKRAGLREVARGFVNALFAMLMPIIIIGGIISGIFTPTESGVVAVVYALVLGKFVYRELTWQDITRLLYECGLLTGKILFILGTASIFSWLLTVEGIPQQVTAYLAGLNAGWVMMLLLINLILLFVGTFIDTISALVIFTPLLLPLAMSVGVDPIHFGIILAVNLTIGMITPPVGVVLFVTTAIAKLTIREMMRDLTPMIGVLIVALAITTYWPAMVMWIPNLLK